MPTALNGDDPVAARTARDAAFAAATVARDAVRNALVQFASTTLPPLLAARADALDALKGAGQRLAAADPGVSTTVPVTEIAPDPQVTAHNQAERGLVLLARAAGVTVRGLVGEASR